MHLKIVRHMRFCSVSVFVGVLLLACQTTAPNVDAQQSRTTTIAHLTYTPLFDEIDHLKSLIDSGQFEDAGMLFIENRPHFLKAKTTRLTGLVNTLAAGLNAPYIDSVETALHRLENLSPSTSIRETQVIMSNARAATGTYPSHGPFSDPLLQLTSFKTLTLLLDKNVDRLTQAASQNFIHYAPLENADFFNLYPVPVSVAVADVVQKALPALHKNLSEASSHQLRDFIANYGRHIEDKKATDNLARMLVSAMITDSGITSPSALDELAMAASVSHTFKNAWTGHVKDIAFVEATSTTLLREGQIDFPISIDMDLPVNAKRLSFAEALSPSAPRFIIVFQVALAKTSRRVLDLTQVKSRFFAGYQSLSSTTELNSTTPDYLSDEEFANGNVSSTLSGQQKDIIGRPQGYAQPIYYAYFFDKARVLGRRTMTVDYYLIDRIQGQYVKSTFDYAEDKRFNVPYRIARSDPNIRRYVQEYDSEKEVDLYEKNPASVKLSQLLENYLHNRTNIQNMGSLESLRQKIQQDRNTAVADYRANTFDSRPLDDPRFDSTVAIYTGKGSLGSGFFVTPDVILTNWHVVKKSRFVEMSMYDGRETFGTVLGKDVLLDVALVRVQDRGKPVRFYTKQKIRLGQTVEAIGHPLRLKFSITRGVISAVRKHPSINLPKGAGDPVLYIQTDTPINPGNSGGPLFLGDRVIGMNTWGYNPQAASGLNFSVHYSELLAFMKEHLPAFKVLN